MWCRVFRFVHNSHQLFLKLVYIQRFSVLTVDIQGEKLENVLSQRDDERLKLTLGIGDLDDQLALMIAENDELRLKLEMEPRNHEFVAGVRRKLDLKNRNQGAELKIMEREIENLEKERLHLKKNLRKVGFYSDIHASPYSYLLEIYAKAFF